MSVRLKALGFFVLIGLVLAGCPSPVDPGSGSGDGGDPLSSNADLQQLSLAEAALSPAFDPATTSYTASVGNDVDEATVTASAAHSAATVTAGVGTHALVVGSNDIEVAVEAEDGTTKSYTITVTREPVGPSSNADLLTLSLSSGSLSPSFDPGTTTYTASVPFEVTEVTISATPAHSEAAITNGTGAVSLSVGENTVDVVVQAEDDTTKTYTITITREVASSNATLSALSLSEGTLSPAFQSSITTYTAMVDYETTAVSVSATAAESHATVTSGTGVQVLGVGDTTIEIVVEAQDGSTKTYTVTVTRAAASSNANLASLSVSEVAISPSFNPATTAYNATVDFLTTEVTVNASVADPTATINSGTGTQSLSVGNNVIEVDVEAQDFSTKTYSITVTRQSPVVRTFRARKATDGTWYTVQSKLLGSGDHVDVYVEDGHGISTDTADDIAEEFDDNIYDMIHENFAQELDVDGNGKVILLLLDIVDGFDGSGGYVAGYFDPIHMFSVGTEPESNEADMLFMDVDPATPGSSEFFSTVAHEMQHLVNYSVTYMVDSTIQDTWINEGLSSGAEYLYAGEQIASRIDYYNSDPLGSIGSGNTFYIWYGYWELGAPEPDPLANYATAYLFFQWLRIHSSNDTEIYSDILDSPRRDYRAVVDAAELRIDSSLDTWEEVLGSWMQANLMTALGGTGLQSYGGEITPAAWVNNNTGGAGVPLSSGEGVAVLTGGSSFSYPGGSGPSIEYIGVNSTFLSVDQSGPLYIGDVVIAFNSNTLIAESDPTETAILPAVIKAQPSILFNVSGESNAMPETYPIGVAFDRDGGMKSDTATTDRLRFDRGPRR